MKIDFDNIENSFFEIFDQIKVLISQDIWENILLNCTKNEMLVLMLLYRGSDVNMTQIADYLSIPLNTATGIVTRMEKKDMIERVRSTEDKRVVTIVLTDAGKSQINAMMSAFMHYGQKFISTLSADELETAGAILDKVITVLQEESNKETQRKSTVRKIVIE
ncbi:MarR family winged helix-turn-helix transcriptional regulator [Fusibacter ferrireducens]|uniref:MarR family transcriptional regulator n=1 Tax=Fusibacter ferrireducens TaxID=2785058 RepID=A0ABR9ZYP3_9FIRM|nr:MarR family transcriptional regulator [Fusibacter ferrireducens]MBF4695574.1 MarR family transcriptional regulator [Fusibacter ferrireducens]